jgi:hypothetical protein
VAGEVVELVIGGEGAARPLCVVGVLRLADLVPGRLALALGAACVEQPRRKTGGDDGDDGDVSGSHAATTTSVPRVLLQLERR